MQQPDPVPPEQPTSPFARPRGMRAGTIFLIALLSAGLAGGLYYLNRSDEAGPASTDAPTGRPPTTAPVVPGVPDVPGSKTALRGAIDQVKASIKTVRKEIRRTDDQATKAALRAQLQVLRDGLRQLQEHLDDV